jgi:hypothetical protein
MKIKCSICGNEYSKYGIKNHIAVTHEGKLEQVTHFGGKGKRGGWSKGLTKETNVSLRIIGEKTKNFRTGNPGHQHTEDHKIKMSRIVNEKIENGTWHLSFSHARIHVYNGMKFHGKWELLYAKWLDANNIKWTRPDEKFEYKLDGVTRKYTPDFYLISEDCYIEIKGYPTKKDFAKWDYFSHNLKIITGRMLFDMQVITSYKSRKVRYKDVSWE